MRSYKASWMPGNNSNCDDLQEHQGRQGVPGTVSICVGVTQESPGDRTIETRHFGERITIGPALDKEGLERLKNEGITRVIDLRTPGETDPVSPQEEQDLLHGFGTEHLNVPIDWKKADFDDFDTVRRAMDEADGPVYLHSTNGKRAAVIAVAHRAIQKDMTPKLAVREAESMGAFTAGSRAEDFLAEYIAARVGIDLIE
jgi:uncharacterized protein (TIGR01244 family)